MNHSETVPQLVSMPVPRREITLLMLIDDALQRGDALDKIDRLLDMRDREEKHRALRAFDEAISLAKGEMPTILKNKTVSFGAGRTSYKHADLAEIERAIQPVLTKYGLSYRFRSDVKAEQIIVTCMIAHKDGHREENSLPGPADTSGSKNPIQAIGSTTTYLSRYTLMLSLGLAASEDDDGTSAPEIRRPRPPAPNVILPPEPRLKSVAEAPAPDVQQHTPLGDQEAGATISPAAAKRPHEGSRTAAGGPAPPAPSSASTTQDGAGLFEGETATERYIRLDSELGEAAKRGTLELEAAWKKLDKDDKAALKAALDRRHKRVALEVDTRQ